MKKNEDRVAKLRSLVEKAGGPAAFARIYTLKDAEKPIDATYISQILNGHRSFGEKAALNMENRSTLPQGYFDAKTDINIDPGPNITGKVPLISWVQAGEWRCVNDGLPSGEAEEWLPCPVAHSECTFVLKVRGESMLNPHGRPSFQEGDLIFVDPQRQHENGSLVIVRLDQEKETTFKKLVIEGKKKYLRALNPAWPEPIIEVNENATICGVVIFKGEKI